MRPSPEPTERSTLAGCIAQITGAPASEVPHDAEPQRGWLGERGLGLVPVQDAAAFSWAGPWIARRPARDGSGALVGREFMLGEVRCRGRRLCEPCAHLDRLNGGGVLRALVHRGGLRADIVADGTVRVGDRLTPV